MLNTVWVNEPGAAETDAVRELLLAAAEVDGRPELTEDGPLPFTGGEHLLGWMGDDLVGYAHLDRAGDAFGRQVAELIVRPSARRNGYGTALAEALVAGAGEGKLRVWAHGDHPAAARIADRAGFTRARELLLMRVGVTRAQWPELVVPQGIRLRTFEPGKDEQAMIEVNARAFDWHPEQGRLSVDDLRATEREDWFDPAGFFLAFDDSGALRGFHWTKVHPPHPGRFDGEPVGEVYVVGVAPDAQGGGLGKVLTLAGLRYLRDKGLRQIILYVEGDNAPAIAVYERLGFTRYEVDVQYER